MRGIQPHRRLRAVFVATGLAGLLVLAALPAAAIDEGAPAPAFKFRRLPRPLAGPIHLSAGATASVVGEVST